MPNNNQRSLTDQVQTAIALNDPEVGLRVLQRVRDVLAQAPANDQESAAMQRVEARVAAVAIKHLSVEDVEELFEHSTLDLLSLPDSVDVIDNIKQHLFLESFFDERNKRRDRFKAALERSRARIGASQLLMGKTEPVRSTIGNWLKLYTSEIGIGRANSVATARFFSQNENVQKLNDQEQKLLRRLINLYEYLKIRSDDLEGFEGYITFERDDGEIMVVGDGVIEPLYDKEALADIKKQAKQGLIGHDEFAYFKKRYADYFKDVEVLSIWDINSEDITGVDPQQLEKRAKDFFAKQAEQYDKLESRSFQSTNGLEDILKLSKQGRQNDKMLVKQLLRQAVSDKNELTQLLNNRKIQTMLQQEFPDELGDKNKKVIKQAGLSPLALQALLLIVFAKRFSLSAEEAAWHSYQVLEKVPFSLKDFKTLVTYDVTQNKLVWRY